VSKRLDLTTGHYFRRPFGPAKEFFCHAREALAEVEFDTVVGTGLSGAVAASQLSRALRKNLAVVRKPRDGSHSSNPVEGVLGKRWLFVDDLISTGDTFRRTRAAIEKVCAERGHEAEFVGAYLYEDYESERAFRPASRL
jgi:adenine/guanine phosphoribosyltransferase-like PRPP-binding protein